MRFITSTDVPLFCLLLFLFLPVARVLRAQTQALLLVLLMHPLLSSRPREISWEIFSIWTLHLLPPLDHHHRPLQACSWEQWTFWEEDWTAWYVFFTTISECSCVILKTGVFRCRCIVNGAFNGDGSLCFFCLLVLFCFPLTLQCFPFFAQCCTCRWGMSLSR